MRRAIDSVHCEKRTLGATEMRAQDHIGALFQEKFGSRHNSSQTSVISDSNIVLSLQVKSLASMATQQECERDYENSDKSPKHPWPSILPWQEGRSSPREQGHFVQTS